jgi:hypothetical protein
LTLAEVSPVGEDRVCADARKPDDVLCAVCCQTVRPGILPGFLLPSTKW